MAKQGGSLLQYLAIPLVDTVCMNLQYHYCTNNCLDNVYFILINNYSRKNWV
jgi:hypothetical protein